MKSLFKSATAYRIVDTKGLDDLSALNAKPVRDCGPGEVSCVGWENPLDSEADNAFHDITNDYSIICMVTTKKILKAAAINREVKKLAKALSESEGMDIGRKEMMTLKEEVINSALPNALSEEIRTYAYVDWKANLFIVDQHSANKCDQFTSSLREALGSLQVMPLISAQSPDQTMRSWVHDNSQPGHIELNGDATFKNPIDLSQTARVSHVEIDGAGVCGLLEDGMIPQELSLTWSLSETSTIDFKLTDSVTMKSIKFSDELLNINDDYEDAEQMFNAGMLINCSTITKVIKDCFKLFGGVSE